MNRTEWLEIKHISKRPEMYFVTPPSFEGWILFLSGWDRGHPEHPMAKFDRWLGVRLSIRDHPYGWVARVLLTVELPHDASAALTVEQDTAVTTALWALMDEFMDDFIDPDRWAVVTRESTRLWQAGMQSPPAG